MLPDGWKKVSLKEIATVKDGTHKTPNYTTSGVPFLRVTDIKANNIDLSSVKFVSYEEHLELIKRCKPEPGDILYSKNGTIGIPCLIDWDWEFSIFVSLALIKLVNKDIILTQYLVYVLASDLIKEEIRLRAKTGTVTNLHLEEIKEFQILLPPLSEQKKIAAILKSVDEAIAKTQAVIDQTRKVKEGLLQQLLTRGISHTKFKDSVIGKIPESWEVRKLSETALVSYGLTVNQKRREIKNQVPYLTVANTNGSGFNLDEVKTIGMLDGDVERYSLKYGDLLLIEGNGNKNFLGLPSLWKEELPFVLHQNHLIRVRVSNPNVNPEWILYCLEVSRYRSQILREVKTSSGLHTINSRIISNLFVPIPSPNEQEKILLVIKGIVDKIDTELKNLAQLQQMKRGIMQDLLIGRIRVTR